MQRPLFIDAKNSANYNSAEILAEVNTVDAVQLEHSMKVDGLNNVFYVGRGGSRLTFLAQQRRALNITWALAEQRSLKLGATVGIIGGGLAGMTAAVACKILGCKVKMFESTHSLLHLQRGNLTRYVHPNVYDWPADISCRPVSDLPFLNWSEGNSGNIATALLNQWQFLVDGIEIEFQTKVRIKPASSGEGVVSVNGGEEPFNIILLCSGFGIERTLDPIPFLSYWENDNLGRSDLQNRDRKRYLVTGSGDGGLIDIARLIIAGFDHGAFTKHLYSDELEEIRHQFAKIEDELRSAIKTEKFGKAPPGDKDARSALEESAGLWLDEKYMSLTLPKFLEEQVRLRDDTEVFLNDGKKAPFSINASVMNRFTLWMLIKRKAIKYLQGKASPLPSNLGEPYKVKIEGHEGTAEEVFDEVIVRHGPKGSLIELLEDPKLATTLTTVNQNDITWTKQYPSFLSQHLVHYDNELWEKLEKQTNFHHAANNFPLLAARLRNDAEVVAVGYLVNAASYLVHTREGKQKFPDNFMDVTIRQSKWPANPGHYNYSPFGTDTIFCGERIEFTSDKAAVEHHARLGFFVTDENGRTAAITAYNPNIHLNSTCHRAEFNFSRSSEIGSVEKLIALKTFTVVNEKEPDSTNACAGTLVVLGDYYSAENKLGENGLSAKGTVEPTIGAIVVSVRKREGKISRIDIRAATTINGTRFWFDKCFSIIPSNEEPFATPEDIGNLVLTTEGLAVGMVVGVAFGQALALPIQAVEEHFNVKFLTDKHKRKFDGMIMDNFRKSGWFG